MNVFAEPEDMYLLLLVHSLFNCKQIARRKVKAHKLEIVTDD